jgi:hypothetical protein
MRSLSLAVIVALAACHGGSSSHKDMAVAPNDFSASQFDFSKPADLAQPTNGDGGSAIAAACMHICNCFMSATEQGKCETLCVSDDSRYQTWAGSGSGSGSGSLSMPANYSGSLGGMFAGTSSLSSGIPLVPTTACLQCLATASCSDLEQDLACQSVCPYTF